MKKFLSNLGYDGEKLELIIAGGSSGSHLSLLYGYMIQNPPIPIRFILNNRKSLKIALYFIFNKYLLKK